MKKEINMLNLGAGVQSTTVLLMSCIGKLPKLDFAIMSDTGWETAAVYKHLKWLKKYSEKCGIPVIILEGQDIKGDALKSQVRGKKSDGARWASMPYRTIDKNGKVGMIRRQCTSEYKINPVEKYIRRKILGLKPRQRIPKGTNIKQWFGISFDEAQRARASKDHWRDFVYPLIGLPGPMLNRPYTRGMCLQWLKKNFSEINVPRSACVACPFRSNKEWRDLRNNHHGDWLDAIEFDKAIRNCGGMRGQMFVHRDCVPLDEADVDSLEDKGQIDMFDEECFGMCGT